MKILIISHNPVSTFNNMGKTFLNMFCEFSSEELCQLYVRPTVPDVRICNSYYQITDKQALKSIFGAAAGGEVDKSLIDDAVAKSKNGELPSPPPPKSAKASLLLARDLVWKFSRWYSKNLRSWIDREAPTCIFLAPGYNSFIYDVALRISGNYNLPIVTYICDDYYFVNPPKGFMGKKHFLLLCKSTVNLMNKTDELVVICNELSDVYHKHFGVNTHVVMTGAGVSYASPDVSRDRIRTFSYFGNLSDGRNESLARIGIALDHINYNSDNNLTLNIYSSETSQEILSVFDNIKSVSLCGFVSGKVYEDAFNFSDVLIHTESFDEMHIDRVKHSVSTKIADSLASGKPLFAYGPDCISSMKHLIRNNCAVTVTSPDMLTKTIEKAVSDSDYLQSVVKRATEVSREYHDNHNNSNKLRRIFTQLHGEQNE